METSDCGTSETQAWQVLSGTRSLPSHGGLLVSVFIVKISALSIMENVVCAGRWPAPESLLIVG